MRYWEEGWQSIIFDYIENYTLKAGFDGIFLDIVDGFEYYDEEVENAAELMVEFVCEIAEFSRSCANNTNFLIIPQNGEALHEYPEYLQCISGLAKEDIFYNDDTRNSPSEVNYVLNHVQAFQQAGKFVLLTEYCREAPHIADFYALASQHGFIPYSTTRDLDSIIINPGYEPD
ncbi:MAG: Glycoside hydrolase, end-alpha-1, 4-polygalactosaminidase [Promethearchaeota archaeon CR_4]|nr:MAG: Glycoside hydrolase, end-alpha-1, 4-polygalactosaminidase [Candidatus Lokiarchaeota archaeon CR_4]